MNSILYIYIFLIGITFGSFFTLAVYRIPDKKNILNERSYCPNCKHKLQFWDLIPVFSYIFLGGKCRYCKQKIRPRYLLLEIFSGIVFVLFAVSINLNIYKLDLSTIVYFVFGLLYIAGLFIISGIDKEKRYIQNEVMIYIWAVEFLYIIYLCVVENTNIYRYVIYLIALIVLIVIDIIHFRKTAEQNYTLQNLILINTMLIFTYEGCTILTIIYALLIIGIKTLLDKWINRKHVKKGKYNIPIGYYLCVANIIMLISTNLITFYK